MCLRFSKMKHLLGKIFILCSLLLLLTLSSSCSADSDMSELAKISLEKSLANSKPTLAEFGWRECIPCKDMRPILEELAKEYKGRVNVLIVEIPNHEDLAEKYAIRVMPEQIFFDSNGNEVLRHAGFLPKDQIIIQFERMGIK